MSVQRREYKYPKAARDEVKASNDTMLEALKREWLSRSVFGQRGGTITWYLFAYAHAKLMMLDNATKQEDAYRDAFYTEENARAKKYYGVT